MRLRRSLTRALCTWFACVLVGVVAIPSMSARSSAPAEIVAEANVASDALSARPARSERAEQAACVVHPSPARLLLLRPQRVCRPQLAADHHALLDRYLHHCVFLL